MWIELKRWRHGPVPLQLQRLEELRQRGVIAVWACTKGEVLSFVQQVEASR